MLTAFSIDGGKRYAWEANKSEKPFFCQVCAREVILRKGQIRQHHFAHKPPVTCSFGKGESEIHHKAKRAIYEGLKNHPHCSDCSLESKIGDVIPDISAVINGVQVAIEIQKSSMTVEEAARRTRACYKNNLHVIWVIPHFSEMKARTDNGEQVCNVTVWKQFFHSLHYGRLYIWSGELALVEAIHFSDFKRYVEETEYYEPGGNHVTHGGYYKTLKSVKAINHSPYGLLNLAEDFSGNRRREFPTKNWVIPECLLWQDNKQTWWDTASAKRSKL